MRQIHPAEIQKKRRHKCDISRVAMDWRGKTRTLLNTTKLKAHDKEAGVVASEVLPEDKCRRVAHGVDPSLQPEQLLEALYGLGREIYYAITMGKGGLALVTFQGQRPPRIVAFHGEYIRVTLYKPYRVTCHNCLELGHKKKKSEKGRDARAVYV